MVEKIIQNNIQKFRTSLGITQEDLAIKVGVTRQTIISIEKGNYTPSLKLALQFASTFNKKIEDIFWFE
jgi:putative transcriptional regulator